MQDTDVAVGVIPPELRTYIDWGKVSLDEMRWPIGRPDRLATGSVADMQTQDHILVYMKGFQHVSPRLGFRGHISLILSEPRVLHARHWRLLRLTSRRFFRVLTCNQELAQSLPNGLRFPYGSTWITDLDTADTEKTRLVSLIASAKKDLQGHQLRHEIVRWVQEDGSDKSVDVLGRGYKPFEKKSEGLASYRYSVVIENTREPTYFTEKIVDPLLMKTVPIYWGAPDIFDYFNRDGIIQVESAQDIKDAINQASDVDYEARQAAIQDNFKRAVHYAAHEKRAAQAVYDDFAVWRSKGS